VQTAGHLAALRREGERLAVAAERTGPDAAIPTCPGWSMRDLVRHIGDVHRWAAAHVRERRTERLTDITGVAGPLPADADLLAWFRAGHSALLETLEGADPDLRCWSFLPASSPLAFWARRQAHETTIHRADAESPGGTITAVDPAFAVDGIDELLIGFLGRGPEPPQTSESRAIGIRTTDADGEWIVRMGPDWAAAARGRADAQCRVLGGASDVYLLMWNRLDPSTVEVEGDRSLLDDWRGNVTITWGGQRT
jgi:uncharacterized protein (TIGR03083 family)